MNEIISNEIPPSHKCSRCHKDMRIEKDKGGFDCNTEHNEFVITKNIKKRKTEDEIDDKRFESSYQSYIITKQDKNESKS
jgi:hypothetical protein